MSKKKPIKLVQQNYQPTKAEQEEDQIHACGQPISQGNTMTAQDKAAGRKLSLLTQEMSNVSKA